MSESSQTIYVQLLNEGTSAWRPADARFIKDYIYELLLIEHYDPEDEEWEFVPGTLVHCEQSRDRLTAIRKAE